MNNPNDFIALHLAEKYMEERLNFEKTRNLVKSIRRNKPGRLFSTYCIVLSSIGHVLVLFGKRLEKYKLVSEVSEQ
jgi:hypothetical protein